MAETNHGKYSVTRLLLIAGLILSLVLSVSYLIDPPLVDSTNNRTTDIVMALGDEKAPSGAVVIVDIDENSLARYGQWPWPRSRLAQLLDKIKASGAATISLDFILAEPDRTSSGTLGIAVSRGQITDMARPPTDLPDNDKILADTLAKGPYVLGYSFMFRTGNHSIEPCNLHPPGITKIVSSDTFPDQLLFNAQNVVCNRRLFSDAVAHSGFLNAAPDADGILRRVPMLIKFQDHLYPSFALATLMQYEKSDQLMIMHRQPRDGLDIFVGKKAVPLGVHGNLIVQFSHTVDAIEHLSAGDLLEGKTRPERLKGKIVVVGSSAAGLEPVYQTSASQVRSHVDIHAQILDHLLAGQQVIRTRRFLWVEVLVGLVFAVGTGLTVARMRILSSTALCALLLSGGWIGAAFTFKTTGYLLSPLLPSVLVVVNYAVLTIMKTWKNQNMALQALAEKQLQLEELNRSLERRITEAVLDSRQKDRILIQQGRQAAMGEMINNIAHQWRQPLNTLGLLIQELLMNYGSELFTQESLEASVNQSMSLIMHMSQTIDDFGNYFKPDKEKTLFSVNQAVARTLSLVEPSFNSLGIKIEIRETDEAEVYGYANEYAQVLLNILVNCKDAFESRLIDQSRIIVINIFKVDEKSVVTVADNAGGIPENIIEKVFDPYFTTKGPDKGTGIGLYMAKTIIEKNMNGLLTVCNKANGAEFRIDV